MMGRSPCCDKSKVKRGPWSLEEDSILRNHIQNLGTGGNWIALPHKAGLKRCGKSCRLRWLNYLRPDIKLGGFTEEEDNIISSLHSKIGSRWSVIASRLQGRTDNDIKNHWNTKLRKKSSSSNNAIATTSSATSVNPMQFSSPIIFPEQEVGHNPIIENHLWDYYMMAEYQELAISSNSNGNDLNGNMMSSHQENNSGGVTDSADDLLTGGFDIRQVLGEVVNFNHSSQWL